MVSKSVVCGFGSNRIVCALLTTSLLVTWGLHFVVNLYLGCSYSFFLLRLVFPKIVVNTELKNILWVYNKLHDELCWCSPSFCLNDKYDESCSSIFTLSIHYLAAIRLLSASNFSKQHWFHLSCNRILKCGREIHMQESLRLEEG